MTTETRTDLLTVDDAAAILGCSKYTVLRELRAKNLVGERYPFGWRIDPDDLAAYRRAHRTVAPVRRRPGRSSKPAP